MTTMTLLPGWAMSTTILQPLAAALSESLPDATVNLTALPAIQLSSLETDLSSLAQQLTPGLLIGWSLGGMLAVQLHRRFPEHFPRVITLASNACFVERNDWPHAMARTDFKAFYQSYREEPQKTLKRFALLATQGGPHARQRAKDMPWDALDDEQRLHALAVLGMLDNRVALRQPMAPLLHFLGENDALVPVAAAASLAQVHGDSTVKIHPTASHMLPLEQPLWLAAEITHWLEKQDV